MGEWEMPSASWAEEQKDNIEKARHLIAARLGPHPAAYTHSYGCQQNVSDGERLQGVLALLGFSFTAFAREADLIVLNTCAVRENAESRVFGNVGALKGLKEKHPSLLIAVGGCMTQQAHIAEKLCKSYPYVDLVFGANAVSRLPALLVRALEGEKRVFDRTPPTADIVEGLPVRREGRWKAWLPIMQGCDNFCSYCVVPFVRGRERSRAEKDIVREAGALIRGGCRELTLLGQNVNSYGRGLPEKTDFPALLRRLDALEGDFRIRFMTSHPKDCTPALLDAVAGCPKVCAHIHLPVQSGSDRVLERMNRRYTAEDYLRLAAMAREKIPGVHLTSDIIVGFPGETYEDFQRTLALIEAVRFTSLFTFIYSPRPGTKAAAMEDPVPHAEKSRWFSQLLLAQERIGREIHESLVGSTQRVLCEGPGKNPGTLTGRAESGVIVEFTGDAAAAGQFCAVRITGALNWAVLGETV